MKHRVINSLAVFAFLVLQINLVTAQEREWQLDLTDEDAYLIFGVPATADIGLSISCKMGADVVKLFAPLSANHIKSKSHTIAKLVVGATTFPLVPKFSTSKDEPSFEVTLEPRQPIIEALQAADRLELDIDDQKSIFPLAGANLSEFSKLCAKAPAVQNN